MSRLRTRVAIVIASAALLSLTIVAPALAISDRWAWVVVRQVSFSSYVPAAVDRGNSLGATNTVVRNAMGQYKITFGGMGDTGAGGTVHVGAIGGTDLHYCSAVYWEPNGLDVVAGIDCFDVYGDHADSRFVVVFQNAFATSVGRSAYLRADQPTQTATYQPEAAYSYNSTTGINAITRVGVGKYQVRLGGLQSATGVVQLTTYGPQQASCRAIRWHAESAQELVIVKCRDRTGSAVDTQFDLSFVDRQGLKGAGASMGANQAYVWANQPTTPSYQPVASARWSSAAGIPTVTRTSVGAYSVELPGMPRGGAALITPTGIGKARCLLASIRPDAQPQRIGVRCFTLAYQPVDAAFTLAYLK